MLVSFARMLPELVRHSDRTDVFERLPQHLKEAHRPRDVERDDAPLMATGASTTSALAKAASQKRKLSELWDEPEEVDVGDATTGIPMFASSNDASLEDDLALLEGAGF
jgi:hypothetical protein